MSSNSERFEILCFKRFFLIKEFANKLNKKEFWLIDSDLILLDSLYELEIFLKRNSYDCALFTPSQSGYTWTSSPHLSFWTIESLDEFIDFVIKTYRDDFSKIEEKWHYHLENKKPGGICDMTLLYLWQNNAKRNIYNMANSYIESGVLHDLNINLSSNYGEDIFSTTPFFGIKEVRFRSGKYFISLKNGSKDFSVGSLHFQGSAKVYMPYFEKKDGTTLYCFWQLLILKAVMFIRSKLKIRSRLKGLFKIS
jgi:hypothetical protein